MLCVPKSPTTNHFSLLDEGKEEQDNSCWHQVISKRTMFWQIKAREQETHREHEEAKKTAALQAKQSQRLLEGRLEELHNKDERQQEWSETSAWAERYAPMMKLYSLNGVSERWNEAGKEVEVSEGKEAAEECPGCMCDLTPDSKIAFPDYIGIRDNGIWCKHSACRDCYLQHIKSRISENKTIIRCPGLCSEGEESGNPCKWTLEEAHLAIVLVGNRDLTVATEQSSLFHRRQRYLMRDFKKRLATVNTRQLKEWKNAGLVQVCPRCACLVGRNDGCSHISCDCGYHFCYTCGNFLNYGTIQLTPTEMVQQCSCGGDDYDNYGWVQQQLQEESIALDEEALFHTLSSSLKHRGIFYEAAMAKSEGILRRKNFSKDSKHSRPRKKRAIHSAPPTSCSGSNRTAKAKKQAKKDGKRDARKMKMIKSPRVSGREMTSEDKVGGSKRQRKAAKKEAEATVLPSDNSSKPKKEKTRGGKRNKHRTARVCF